MAIRQDRTQGLSGGYVTFVKEGIPYTVVSIGGEEEYVVVTVWAERKPLVIVNIYNLCGRLKLERLELV